MKTIPVGPPMGLDEQHSFVVLAYRRSPYLQECIHSLLSQTTRSPIVIATSTPCAWIEDTAARNRLSLFVNPVEKGIGSDWTFAYGLAQSRFVTLAHQDDVYSPLYTESCLNAADRVSDSIIVFSDYFETTGAKCSQWNTNLLVKRCLLGIFFPLGWPLRSPILRNHMLTFGSPIACPSVMYHKAAIGEFSFSPTHRFVLDWDAWLRLAKLDGSFVYVRRRLLAHRLHAESATSRATLGAVRAEEEEAMFFALWPRPVASLLSRAYSLGWGTPVR